MFWKPACLILVGTCMVINVVITDDFTHHLNVGVGSKEARMCENLFLGYVEEEDEDITEDRRSTDVKMRCRSGLATTRKHRTVYYVIEIWAVVSGPEVSCFPT